MSGLLVPHHLPKFAQVHVHCISDVIQPSHPLMPFSPSAFNLSQHQGLFQWVGCSHQVTKILELQLQQQSSNEWIFRVDFLEDWLVGSPCCQRDSQESSPSATVQKHQFFSALHSLLSRSHNQTWLLKILLAELNYLQWLCQSEVLGKGWQIRSAKHILNQLIMSTQCPWLERILKPCPSSSGEMFVIYKLVSTFLQRSVNHLWLCFPSLSQKI